jgi:hypothetical protein
MKSFFRVVIGLAIAALLPAASVVADEAPPNGIAANSHTSPGHCGKAPLTPGLVIDAHNVANYECYLPAAAIAVVKHGFKIRLATTHKLDWPMGFKHATEKYSPQVHLDSEDNLANYVAGMPFPLVNVDDPKAARKIAYNWHMGPFMPDDFSLAPWGSGIRRGKSEAMVLSICSSNPRNVRPENQRWIVGRLDVQSAIVGQLERVALANG